MGLLCFKSVLKMLTEEPDGGMVCYEEHSITVKKLIYVPSSPLCYRGSVMVDLLVGVNWPQKYAYFWYYLCLICKRQEGYGRVVKLGLS